MSEKCPNDCPFSQVFISEVTPPFGPFVIVHVVEDQLVARFGEPRTIVICIGFDPPPPPLPFASGWLF